MGLFSFLKRKNQAPAAAPETLLRAAQPSRLDTEAERARQREIARATAAKIDAIELAMASDIFNDEPEWGSLARRPSAAVASAALPLAPPADPDPGAGAELPDAAAVPASAPVVEESAILYANGQLDAAEQLLRASLAELGPGERQPWWMLFDLYQASGREAGFHSIAIDYASHFETAPPAWRALIAARAPGPAFSGVTPTESFSAMLDEGIEAQLERLRQPAPAGPLVRLEFGEVLGATPEGCACLLAALQALRAGGRELVIGGADALVAVLRPMLAIGEPGASPAPWLLLLELLQLLNREKDFEETAMDYCVTFEVAPPSFEAPLHVATAAPGSPVAGDRFMLPALVEGDCKALLAAIDGYAGQGGPVVLDCSRLARIDYAAASALQGALRRLAGDGCRIELREVNHMVLALFRLLGYEDSARLFGHRY